MTIGHNSKNVNASITSLSQDDLKTLKKGVLEMNDSLTRSATEKELQKEIVDELNERLGINKSLVRRIAKAYYNANYTDEVEKNREFEESYDLVDKTVV